MEFDCEPEEMYEDSEPEPEPELQPETKPELQQSASVEKPLNLQQSNHNEQHEELTVEEKLRREQLLEDKNHYMYSTNVRLLSIRETVLNHMNSKDIYPHIQHLVYPFFPKQTPEMSYLEVRKIFDFLKNLNNLLWSMDKKDSVIEMLTIENSQAFEWLSKMKIMMELAELEKNKNKIKKDKDRVEGVVSENKLVKEDNNEKSNEKKQLQVEQDTFDEFKKGTFGLVSLYIDCKCALKQWPRETSKIAEDRIIHDVLKAGYFGDSAELKKSIFDRIDKVMVMHMEKEEKEKQLALRKNNENGEKGQNMVNQWTRNTQGFVEKMKPIIKWMLKNKGVSFPAVLFLIFLLVKQQVFFFQIFWGFLIDLFCNF